MPGSFVKYAPVQLGDRLYQGEIVARIIQVRQTVDSIGTDAIAVAEIEHQFALVLTQECDLEQDFNKRKAGQPGTLENVLLCRAIPVTELKTVGPQGKTKWDLVRENRDPRYQCLEAVPLDQDSTGEGIASIGCDFKRYFTLPTDEFYRRIELKQIVRRSRLVTPYAEHLLQRFCNFQARIPLPENHDVPL